MNSDTSLRILLVDDDELATDLRSFAFSARGDDVKVAPNCERGIHDAATFKPDIVFIDVGLPGNQAIQIAHALRCTPETRGTWLVALNAHDSSGSTGRVSDAAFHFQFGEHASIDDLLDLAEARRRLAHGTKA